MQAVMRVKVVRERRFVGTYLSNSLGILLANSHVGFEERLEASLQQLGAHVDTMHNGPQRLATHLHTRGRAPHFLNSIARACGSKVAQRGACARTCE